MVSYRVFPPLTLPRRPHLKPLTCMSTRWHGRFIALTSEMLAGGLENPISVVPGGIYFVLRLPIHPPVSSAHQAEREEYEKKFRQQVSRCNRVLMSQS